MFQSCVVIHHYSWSYTLINEPHFLFFIFNSLSSWLDFWWRHQWKSSVQTYNFFVSTWMSTNVIQTIVTISRIYKAMLIHIELCEFKHNIGSCATIRRYTENQIWESEHSQLRLYWIVVRPRRFLCNATLFLYDCLKENTRGISFEFTKFLF